MEPRPLNLKAEIFVLVLALFSIGLLLIDLTAELAPHQQRILERVDLVIACLFLADFLWRLYRAEDRWRFFRKSWWELLASIPMTLETTRALRSMQLLRLLRIVRLLRVLRFAVRVKILLDRAKVFGDRTQLVKVTLFVTAIVIGGASAFHYFEFGVNPTVKGFGDSIWWSIITVTTVGYGDIYPHTTGGRVVATLLLVTGLGTFGAWAASMAAWIMESRENKESTNAHE
jgi:voltage-gated potassium channel